MKKIKLTQGKVAIIDDEDFEFINQWKWCIQRKRKGYNDFYAKRSMKGILMHRVIMNVSNSMILVDHINGNTLDNRKINLRTCTRSTNQQNRKKHKELTSKYKGVSYDITKHKWIAYLSLNNIDYGRKAFKKEADAVKHYNALALKYFGEFSKLNIL